MSMMIRRAVQRINKANEQARAVPVQEEQPKVVETPKPTAKRGKKSKGK